MSVKFDGCGGLELPGALCKSCTLVAARELGPCDLRLRMQAGKEAAEMAAQERVM